ncbi:hypothetical protein Tco_0510575, partial [Tanacetum coccineum]
ALLEDPALYDNESWNDPRDFAKPIKVITLPQDVPSTSDHRLIELENQVQRLMEAHLALTQPTQVNKITTLYEIRSSPHDTQYCMEDPEQAFPYQEGGAQKKGNQKPIKAILPKVPLLGIHNNPSAPKHVHFIISIIILSKESEAEEGETMIDITPKHGHNITKEAKEEVKEVIDKEESKVETDEEVEEILTES